ncbi:Gx transporter family protein [Eubacteriales bacterium OttesenSCG-928-A19]|nr:Gx transporter family protein [Eubacteriales bacterium OttesenSCG-928-A19]
MKKKTSAQTVATGGLLTAVMLVLGYVEHMIPIGSAVPGIKLGLSNSVLLFALYMMGARQAFVLMLVKVVLSGLLFGGVSAMMYSFAGGLLSMLAMILMRRMPGVGIVGVSVVGAVMHNVGQVGMAMLVLQTSKLMYYMAILILVGVGTGALTGIVAGAVMQALGRIAARKDLQ